ncbi:MAG: pyruvate carboxylase subunit B [Betaproteobacteria bacterium]|nr:pyruvate carboxylase subunit B [Betaproteobacteria bacterium]
MSKTIGIIETTMRDGQQSLWATRMTTAMTLPILPALDEAGFHAIEFMGTAVMEACVRYLDEDPWERMRMVRGRVRRTRLGMISPVLGFSVSRGAIADDVSDLFFTRCAANGIDHFFFNDGLNDIRNYEVPVAAARRMGATIVGTLTYSISPVHTDAYYVAKVAELLRLGVDTVVLKDPNGILTPERVRSLVPALCGAAGNTPVFIHSHCVTGLGPATNLAAIESGATGTWTCAAPLANGSSLPATASMLRHLRRMRCRVALDSARVEEIDEHFRRVALRHAKPMGEPAEYDPSWYQHQMPGGMISNFRAQLAQLGLAHRLTEVLDLIPAVRADLGWAPMVTPFSQMVATQAALNMLYGPYAVILDEVRRLALGYYGETPAPLEPNLLDRATRGREPIRMRPGALLAPDLERFRRERGPFASDDDLLLAYFFMPDQLRRLRAAGPIRVADELRSSALVELVRDVAGNEKVSSFHLHLATSS